MEVVAAGRPDKASSTGAEGKLVEIGGGRSDLGPEGIIGCTCNAT